MNTTSNTLNEQLSGGFKFLEAVGKKRVFTIGGLIILLVVLSIVAIIADGKTLFVQRLVDGFNNGFIYSAMALALVLIYKATSVVNFAQGSMAMFGTFICYVFAVNIGMPAWLAIIAGMAVSALIAAGIERVLIRPFDPRNHLAITIVTLGLLLVLASMAGVIWAYDPRAFPTPFPLRNKSFGLLGAHVAYTALFTWITIIVAVVAVSLLLIKTKIGLAFRSVSSNLESSQLIGIHIGRTLQFGWALATAMGTLAGSLIANTTLLDPNFMDRVLIFSFAAATLGGLDSLGGAVIAGIIIGMVQTMSGGYIHLIGSVLAPTVALLVIVVVLLIRPSGLFGSKRVERV
ncbi:MAG: putative branched-chain amino acid transporter ATP-binding protein [Ilumatobacteraceae bacterium]|nr:putative branched-chain amino acid transporter ATP-binding protein [Ilumatobacteraceae bacterium]